MFTDLLDLVLPQRCVGCGAPGRALCPACLPGAPPLARDIAGVGAVHAASGYAGAVRTALLQYKEHDRRDLAPALSDLLLEAVLAARGAASTDRLIVVPIPSDRRAARARGGDHMRRLATRTARRAGLPAVALLRRVRRTEDAVGLDARERRRNIDHALQARPRAPADAGRQVILVDDIVTTGASLGEAGRALAAAGWTVAGRAVVASTPPHRAGANPRC